MTVHGISLGYGQNNIFQNVMMGFWKDIFHNFLKFYRPETDQVMERIIMGLIDNENNC